MQTDFDQIHPDSHWWNHAIWEFHFFWKELNNSYSNGVGLMVRMWSLWSISLGTYQRYSCLLVKQSHHKAPLNEKIVTDSNTFKKNSVGSEYSSVVITYVLFVVCPDQKNVISPNWSVFFCIKFLIQTVWIFPIRTFWIFIIWAFQVF